MSKRLNLEKLRTPEVEEMAKERPYALQVIQMQILYDMADLLEELVERNTRFQTSWEETIPKGELEPLTFAITDMPTELSPRTVGSMPWMRFTLHNDGPNPVFIMVNEEYIQNRTPLNIGEHITVDMVKPKVDKVYLHCAPTLTASVRIFALR